MDWTKGGLDTLLSKLQTWSTDRRHAVAGPSAHTRRRICLQRRSWH